MQCSRGTWRAVALVSLFAFLAPATPLLADALILGEYVEIKARDVQVDLKTRDDVGPIRGEAALVSWAIHQGSWEKQDLSGLKAAAAIQVDGTFLEPSRARVETVLYVDQRATDEQRAALASLVRNLAGKRLGRIVAVERAPIRWSREHPAAGGGPEELTRSAGDEEETGRLLVEVAEAVRIETRIESENSSCACGKSERSEPPLSRTDIHRHARTLSGTFRRGEVDIRTGDPRKTEAVVGVFSY